MTPLERIKLFNNVKRIIHRASYEKDGHNLIDIKLFENLMREIRYRMKIESQRCLQNGTPVDETFEAVNEFLMDFSLINPVKIANALAAEDD